MSAPKPLALVFQFLQAGMGKAATPTARKPSPSRSAEINRWTGKPHEHKRAKARRLTQLACLRIHAWGDAWTSASTRTNSARAEQ